MNRTRVTLFIVFVVTSTLLTAAYVWQAKERAVAPPALAAHSTPQPLTGTGATDPLTALRQTPRLFSIDLNNPESRGYVKVAALAAPDEQSVITPLRCRRMHFAAGAGICLREVVGD
jgi:hypothetical protein